MEEKKRAIIFDVDGTLAHMNGRIARHGKKAAPFIDTDSDDDDLDEQVSFLAKLIPDDISVIICSGRKDSSKEVTEQWLKDNGIRYNAIFMRKHGDDRKDSIIKREIYENFIEPNFDVFLVVDDRDQVVDMWRNELGLKCFQVAEGSF